MAAQVSVILICERAEQLTGSGCCGKLEGENALLGTGDLFQDTRTQQQALGVLYRALRQFFALAIDKGQLTVVSVDPRNQLYLVPKLWRDVWSHRPGWKAGLVTACQLFAMPAVIINGQVISKRGQVVAPDTVCHHVAELLTPAQLPITPITGTEEEKLSH